MMAGVLLGVVVIAIYIIIDYLYVVLEISYPIVEPTSSLLPTHIPLTIIQSSSSSPAKAYPSLSSQATTYLSSSSTMYYPQVPIVTTSHTTISALHSSFTLSTTTSYYCPEYSASNTYSDTINFSICPITACPGDTITMTTSAPGSCSGDNYLRLYDPSTGEQLTYNDDYDGVCSQITYTFTASCRTYELREGCWSSGSCGGVVYYTGSSAISQSPLVSSTSIPTTPTQVPSTVFPTQKHNISLSERQALNDLYISTNGNEWYNRGGWNFINLHSDPCELNNNWFGVGCMFDDGDGYFHIIELILNNNGLHGTISNSIDQLTILQSLYFSFNSLHGTIPESIGNLTMLITLVLNHNQLEGNIIHSLTQLSNLNDLHLDHNLLNGTIPETIGQLHNLYFISLSNNQLNGTIPSSIGSISTHNNIYLDVSNNKLNGTLPDSLGNLPYLYEVDVSRNELDGFIPYSLCNIYHNRLNLSHNSFDCYPSCLTDSVYSLDVGSISQCINPSMTPTSAYQSSLPTFSNQSTAVPTVANSSLLPITTKPSTINSPTVSSIPTSFNLSTTAYPSTLTTTTNPSQVKTTSIPSSFLTTSCPSSLPKTDQLSIAPTTAYPSINLTSTVNSSSLATTTNPTSFPTTAVPSAFLIATTKPTSTPFTTIRPTFLPIIQPSGQPLILQSSQPTSQPTAQPCLSFRPLTSETTSIPTSSLSTVAPTVVPTRSLSTTEPAVVPTTSPASTIVPTFSSSSKAIKSSISTISILIVLLFVVVITASITIFILYLNAMRMKRLQESRIYLHDEHDHECDEMDLQRNNKFLNHRPHQLLSTAPKLTSKLDDYNEIVLVDLEDVSST